MTEFYISSNEEHFSNGPYETEQDAIEEGKASYDGEPFYVGERKDYTPWTRDYVADWIENEATGIGEECGEEASDDWPPRLDSHSAEYKAANEKIVSAMRELCGEPTSFAIINVKQIDPTEEKEESHD